MSNRAIRAVSKHCHAQGDSNYRYPWPSLDRLHSLADLRPIGAGTRYGDPRCAHGDAARVLRRGTRVAHESGHSCLHSAHRSQHQSARAKYGRCLGDRRSNREKTDFPAALSELLGVSWPVTVVPDQPPGTVGITESTIGTIWQIFGNSEYGLARFEVTAPSALPQHQRFRLTFRLLQWRWRLVAVTLPENIQNLLGDQLAKTLRTPVQNR